MNTRCRIARLAFLGTAAGFLLLQMTVSAATLINRWSFNEAPGSLTVTDSVSGVVGTLQGDAMLDGAQVDLSGTSNSCVTLPGGLLNGMQAVTFDGWVTTYAVPDNVCLFEFSDEAGTGANYIRYVLHDQNNNRNLFEIAAGGVSGLSAPVGLGGQIVHVTCVYDPVNQVQAVYTNGILEVAKYGVTIPLSNVATNGGSLGRSPWYAFGDPFMAGTIDEFRIWNGALNPLQIAAGDAAGPDTVSTNYGTITGVALQVDFQMTVGSVQAGVVKATASGLPYAVDISTLATFSSGDTNILEVSANGDITAVALGSTTVTASYGGLSDTQTVTVVPATATLVHRYSFTSDASDSVGGLNGTLMNGATVSGGMVHLDSAATNYVSLPSGVLSGITNVVFEAWFTNDVLPDNTCLFEFSDEGGTGNDYIRFVIKDQGNTRNQFELARTPAGDSQLLGYPGLGGQAVQLALIYSPSTQIQAIFTNGVLEAVKRGPLPALSNVSANAGSLGRSPWFSFASDPNLTGAIDEFRVYSGETTPQRIALDYLAGPDTLTTNSEGALQSIALSVPPTMMVATSQTYGLLANYANLTNFDLIGNNIYGTIPGLVVTSSDTNVVMVSSASSVITSVNPGTATITATYQGKTSVATVLVTRPALQVVDNVTNLTVRWPVAAAGFTLYSSPSLGSGAAWTAVSGQPSVVGTNNEINVTPSGSAQFFRLEQ